jgi:hypothetical protein
MYIFSTVLQKSLRVIGVVNYGNNGNADTRASKEDVAKNLVMLR